MSRTDASLSTALEQAREVFRVEAEAVRHLADRLDANFEQAVEWLMDVEGRIVVTGMGKPGFIAQKMSATLASTGVASLYLHPAEAVHGDLGRVTAADVVIAYSNSGETEEVVKLLPLIKRIGARLIAITGNTSSTLAKNSDLVLDIAVESEACPLNLSPTASTTAMLAMGDALAMSVASSRGLQASEFAFFHPGGNIGKQLMMTKDVMRTGENNPVVAPDTNLRDVLLLITKARAGSATVVGDSGQLLGIFTDGDLRRHLEQSPDIMTRTVESVMTRDPVRVRQDQLAAETLHVLEEHQIDEVPVVDEDGRVVGLVDVQDLLRAGVV